MKIDDKNIRMHKFKPQIVEVVENTIKNGIQTSRTLNGAELEQWKKDHGYDSTENETESDTK